jgi:hypothetical protein
MILDSEKQRKILKGIVGSVRIEGNIDEAERTVKEIRELMSAIENAPLTCPEVPELERPESKEVPNAF